MADLQDFNSLTKLSFSNPKSRSCRPRVFSILHISDLHRSPEEPVDNSSLLAALLADRDRYVGEIPIVPPPQAIIVSGDLIRGARIGSHNWEQEIREQYRVASEFLDQLARRFLDGDRSKLIIVPGNHDVCWNTSYTSMESVPKRDYPDDVLAALCEPNSNYRWCWKTQTLYRIRDGNMYNRRLDAYWNFVQDFYSGTRLASGIRRDNNYQVFELDDRRIVVAAFDSNLGTDCFSQAGRILPGAVGKCSIALRDARHIYDLRIAVWHHSIQGPPMRQDYMDVGQVHEMVGLGFQLGFHGHQHLASATVQFVHVSESQAMGIVSAGSLCAGARELPRGVNRQYNLVVIDDNYRGDLHPLAGQKLG